MRGPVSAHNHQHLVLSDFLDFSHSDGWLFVFASFWTTCEFEHPCLFLAIWASERGSSSQSVESALPSPWRKALFRGEAEAQERRGTGSGSHRNGHQQQAPVQDSWALSPAEGAQGGSDSVAHSSQMEPSWASGAAAGEGRGLLRPHCLLGPA